jgi:hypothetical protein
MEDKGRLAHNSGMSCQKPRIPSPCSPILGANPCKKTTDVNRSKTFKSFFTWKNLRILDVGTRPGKLGKSCADSSAYNCFVTLVRTRSRALEGDPLLAGLFDDPAIYGGLFQSLQPAFILLGGQKLTDDKILQVSSQSPSRHPKHLFGWLYNADSKLGLAHATEEIPNILFRESRLRNKVPDRGFLDPESL